MYAAEFPAYLFRGLPIYGKIIVSTTFLCFKSSGPLAKTRVRSFVASLAELLADLLRPARR